MVDCHEDVVFNFLVLRIVSAELIRFIVHVEGDICVFENCMECV